MDPNAVGKCLEHNNPRLNPRQGWKITGVSRNLRDEEVYDLEYGQQVASVTLGQVVRIYDCDDKDVEMKAGKKRRRKTRRPRRKLTRKTRCKK